MEYYYRKTLPSKYKGRGKKIGKVFSVPNKYYGSVDVLIRKAQECEKCGCWIYTKTKECSRCKSNKLITLYIVNECSYSVNTCKVNRWGCAIHYKSLEHPFTCVCDECM